MDATGAEVSEKDAAVAVPICVKGPVEDEARSILKPDSFEELSDHARSIRLDEKAVAPRPEGAAGGLSGVVAPATLEGAEVPAVLYALTR